LTEEHRQGNDSPSTLFSFPAGEFLKSKIGDYAKIRNIFIAGEERGWGSTHDSDSVLSMTFVLCPAQVAAA